MVTIIYVVYIFLLVLGLYYVTIVIFFYLNIYNGCLLILDIGYLMDI